MPKNRVKFILIINIFILLFFSTTGSSTSSPAAQTIIDTLYPDSSNDVVKITRSWELPSALKKIAGINYLETDRIACIQDEVGSIFIYNLETKAIEKEIPFGPPGDYEGIALVNENAYVVCGDGRIYEILNYRSDKPVVKEYGTHLTVKQNADGLCYDSKNKRLLVTIKGMDEANKHYKAIFAFNLATRSMPVKPVIRINLKDTVFNRFQTKKIQTVFQPSDLDIHPLTQEIFIVDGERSQLLIMNGTEIKDLLVLNKTTFVQPEGISFTPSGELYIASKGFKEEPGMLMLVNFNK